MNIQRMAAIGILIILTFFVVLHGLILLGMGPFQVVWGGRLTEYSQMVTFESVSLSANLLMIAVVLVQAGWVRLKIKARLLKGTLWGMAALFGLNSLGNALSSNVLEKSLFTPLTLLLCLGCSILSLSKGTSLQTLTRVK